MNLTEELKASQAPAHVVGNGINTMNQLKEYIYKKKKGEIVNLKITRGKN